MSTQAFGWSKSKEEDNAVVRQFASDVRNGLAKPQKELHSKYLYDELGSSLFEAITHLPEYGLDARRRTPARRHARDIASLLPSRVAVIELGSGVGQKTRHLLRGHWRRSAALLSHRRLGRRPGALRARFVRHRRSASAGPVLSRRNGARHRRTRNPAKSFLVMFLGSTIGNFERTCALEFLRDLRRALASWRHAADRRRPGEGTRPHADGLRRSHRRHRRRSISICSGRINRELGGDFQLRHFEHQARWNEPAAPHRNAPTLTRESDRVSIAEADLTRDLPRRRDHLDRVVPQIPARGAGRHGGADRLSASTGQWVDDDWPFAESLWTVS